MSGIRLTSMVRAGLAVTLALLLAACAGSGEPQSVQKARGLLDEAWATSPDAKLLVLSLVADYPGLEVSRRYVNEALASDVAGQKIEALAVLARWRDPSMQEQVMPLLEESNEVVRLLAAEALAAVGDASGQEILENAIRDRDELLVVDRCALLANVGSRTCFDAAVSDIRSKSLPKVAAAADAIAAYGDEQGLAVLRSELKNLRGERRAPVIEALGRVGDESDVARVLPFIRFRENVLAVVRALGSLGGEQAIETLKEYAASDDPLARAEAAGALLRIGVSDEEVLAVFDATVASERTDMRYLAARLLGNVPEAAGVGERLERLAGDVDPQVRREAMRGIVEIADVERMPLIESAWAADANAPGGAAYEAAQLALRAAGRIRSPAAEALLAGTLESDNWAHVIQASLGLIAQHKAGAAVAGQ